MQRKKLPIGIQTFREIRENLAYYYADKYRAPDVAITLIGIAFSPSERNVVGFETLTLDTAAQTNNTQVIQGVSG